MRFKFIQILLLILIILTPTISAKNLAQELGSNILYGEDLKDFSDKEIRTYIEENTRLENKVEDIDSNKIYYYYKTKTIEQDSGRFRFKDLDIQTSMNLEDWKDCNNCENVFIEQRDEIIEKTIERIIAYKDIDSSKLKKKKPKEKINPDDNPHDIEEHMEFDFTLFQNIMNLFSFDAITGNYLLGNSLVIDPLGNIIILNNLDMQGNLTTNNTLIVPTTNITMNETIIPEDNNAILIGGGTDVIVVI